MQRTPPWLYISAALIFLVLPAAGALAATSSKVFTNNTDVKSGMLVSISSADVVPAVPANCPQLIGVAIPPTDPVATTGNRIEVATEGSAQIFVSNLTGGIAKGDAIGCSILQGVGEKAENGFIIGRALAGIDKATLVHRSVTGLDGKTRDVEIGSVPVLINVENKTESNSVTTMPPWLQSLTYTVSGKHPSALRVIAALIIVVVVLILAGTTLFAGIRYNFVAIGRNPLAAPHIHTSLLRVIISGAVISIAGFLAAYLIIAI